jgi:hypothetical protein
LILLSVGLPGRFTRFCEAVMARLAGCAGGTVVASTWPSLAEMFSYEPLPPTLDELARVLISGSSSHVVIGVRQPDARLRSALSEGNTRFVLAFDDPCTAAAEIIAEEAAAPRVAVRTVANCCPLVMQFEGLPGALTLRADQAGAEPAAAVAAIAQHLGLSTEPGQIAAIVEETGLLGPWGPSVGGDALAALPAGTRKMIEGALLGYRHRFFDGNLDRLVWTRDLFLVIDPGKAPNGPLDLAGGPRDLIFGPYIHLPPGSWTAQAVLGFSPDAAGSAVVVDAFAGAQLACATLQPNAPGIVTAELNFTVGEPSGNGVEVRVIVAGEQARGQLALGHVVLTPLALSRSEALVQPQADFAAVLEL